MNNRKIWRPGIFRACCRLRVIWSDCMHADIIERIIPHLLNLLPYSITENRWNQNRNEWKNNRQTQIGKWCAPQTIDRHVDWIVAFIILTEYSTAANPFPGVFIFPQFLDDNSAVTVRKFSVRIEVEIPVDCVRLRNFLIDTESLLRRQQEMTRR